MSRVRRGTLGAFLGAVFFLAARPADAQDIDPEDDLGRLAEAVADLISKALEDTNESVFEFLETVELYDIESEIDRFVGSPWELNDSTAYKLSLLPWHVRYPIYRQLVRQMTRQDDLRSRRIHTVSPDSVKVIALGLETLEVDIMDYDPRVSTQVRESLTKHFAARELIDLGFFLLAQQAAFPQTDEGWRLLKRNIAAGGPFLAVGALVAGAAFDLGAFQRARPFLKRDYLQLGWYAGFKRFGFSFHPQVRGGLTLKLPGLELAGGLWEQIEPVETDRTRAVELAMREGWLGRITRPGGWDVFFETALRQVLAAEPLYEGEDLTGRAGLFFKRHQIPRLMHVTLRAGFEIESDFVSQIRFGTSLGFEHEKTGLTTVFQASRAPLILETDSGPIEYLDTRGGVFLTWTVEPLSQGFVDGMRSRARQVMDEWEQIRDLDREREVYEKRLRFLGTSRMSVEQARAAIDGIEKTLAEREERMVRMAGQLADYLENRRFTYSILRWSRSTTDLYGPLDPTVLAQAREEVFHELHDVSGQLERTPAHLEMLRTRYSLTRGRQDAPRQEVAALERQWHRESERAGARVETYRQFRDAARRIVNASNRAEKRTRNTNPVRRGVIKQVLSMRTRSPW